MVLEKGTEGKRRRGEKEEEQAEEEAWAEAGREDVQG